MKILAVGDPHGNYDKIKKIPLNKIDLILLTGDTGKADYARKFFFENVEREKKGLPKKEYDSSTYKKVYMEIYDSTIKIVKYLSRQYPVYLIFGNVESHNVEVKRNCKKYNLNLPFLYDDLNSIPNVKVINNRIVKFKGVRIGGLEYFTDTNWVREFRPSDFKERMYQARKETDKAKRILKWFDSLDILICHQPPYKILDKVTWKSAPDHWKGKHAGSKTILNYVKRKQPKYVFCGHIHERKGVKQVGKTKVYNLGVAGYKIIEYK